MEDIETFSPAKEDSAEKTQKLSNSINEGPKQEYFDEFKKTTSTLKANASGHINMLSLNEDLRISKKTINYAGSNSHPDNQL